jgi:drug/metabolite transporter (DMT)-like permease
MEQFRESHKVNPGPWLILIAAVLWSTAGVLARAPQLQLWPEIAKGGIVAFWRSVFALVVLIPLIRQIRWNWVMLPMAICFAGMNWTYLTALTTGPAANAIWLQNIAPVWVMLFSVLVLKVRFGRRDLWMVAFCLTGLGIIIGSQVNFASLDQHAFAAGLGVASSFLFAGVVLSLRALRDYDPAWLISLNHLVNAFVMAPFALHAEFIPSGSQWWPLIAIGIFQMGLSYWLFARGLKSTAGHTASLIALLEPVLLPLWVFLAWRNASNYEPVESWTLFGAGCILIGLVIRFLPTRWQRSDPKNGEQTS